MVRAYTTDADMLIAHALPRRLPESAAVVSESAPAYLIDVLGNETGPDTLLKEQDRKTIALYEGSPPMVSKGFEHRSIKNKINHRNTAYAEAANLIKAASAGVRVPVVYALQQRTRIGIPTSSTVFMEYVAGTSLRDVFMNKAIDLKYLLGLMPVIKQLHAGGVHHIDFGPHALLESTEGELVCIDFQYAAFFSQPVPENTAHMLGYFGWAVCTNRGWCSRELMDTWYEETAGVLGFADNQQCKNIYLAALRKRHSTEERLAGFANKLTRL